MKTEELSKEQSMVTAEEDKKNLFVQNVFAEGGAVENAAKNKDSNITFTVRDENYIGTLKLNSYEGEAVINAQLKNAAQKGNGIVKHLGKEALGKIIQNNEGADFEIAGKKVTITPEMAKELLEATPDKTDSLIMIAEIGKLELKKIAKENKAYTTKIGDKEVVINPSKVWGYIDDSDFFNGTTISPVTVLVFQRFLNKGDKGNEIVQHMGKEALTKIIQNNEGADFEIAGKKVTITPEMAKELLEATPDKTDSLIMIAEIGKLELKKIAKENKAYTTKIGDKEVVINPSKVWGYIDDSDFFNGNESRISPVTNKVFQHFNILSDWVGARYSLVLS